MAKFLRKFLICFLLAAILLIVQTSLIGKSFFFSGFNFILAGLVVLIAAFTYEDALLYLIFAGALMDSYSLLPFGVFTLSLFFSSLFLELLLLNFFTNRSLYSLLGLGFSGVLLYNIFFASLVWLGYVSGLNDFSPDGRFWLSVLWQVIVVPVVLAFGFIFINKFSRHFKPIFVK